MTDQIIITESTLAHFERRARARIEAADVTMRHLVPGTIVLVVLLVLGSILAWVYGSARLCIALGALSASPILGAFIVWLVLRYERRRAEEVLALRVRSTPCAVWAS